MTVPTITAAWLVSKNACHSCVASFRQTFGDSASVTRASLENAVYAGLPLWWLADIVLTDEAWDESIRARTRSLAANQDAHVDLLANLANWRDGWDA